MASVSLATTQGDSSRAEKASLAELLLLADAGDVTRMGVELFATLGKRVDGMPAIVLRKARAACKRELRATIAWMIDNRRSLALLAKERVRAIRITFFELQWRFFRGFVKAAERLTARLR